MYSWDDDTTSWYGKSSYAYSTAGAERRAKAASRAAAAGGRTYERRRHRQRLDRVNDLLKHAAHRRPQEQQDADHANR